MSGESDQAPKRRRDPKQERVVWAAAAGRCTLCNRSVLENEDLGAAVTIGELAHNIGWGKNSPRGKDRDLGEAERAAAANLLLLCRNCHKPIDDDGCVGLYSWEQLLAFKQEHERRVRFLTSIGADRSAHIFRLVGEVRNATPALHYDAVLSAATAQGLFPARLPDAFHAEVEVDLLRLPGAGTPQYYQIASLQIDQQIRRVSDGIAAGDVKRLAVFAFGRIPLLVYLGAHLDDKIETFVFQRQRVDNENSWRWPLAPDEPCDFEFMLERVGHAGVAVLLNLSGHIQLDELPDEVSGFTIYSVRPASPATCSPLLISSPRALSRFEHTVRCFLASLEATHGKIDALAVFPAIPISAAVTLGRVLMPNVSPRLDIYDRNDSGQFSHALSVSKAQTR